MLNTRIGIQSLQSGLYAFTAAQRLEAMRQLTIEHGQRRVFTPQRCEQAGPVVNAQIGGQ
ncbi:hypothetical protein D3C78_1688500 [compost metagenome]